jgi:hypothetical protein
MTLKSTMWWLAALTVLAVSLNAQERDTDTSAPPQENTQRSEPAPAVSAPVLSSSAEPEAEDVPIEQHIVPIPAIIGGFSPTLAFSSSINRSNLLRAGINVGGSYDDNALITPTNAIGNWGYSIFPNISIQQTRSRLRWDLGYSAGLTVNQELSSRNQGSHDLNLNLLYRLSPHVNLLVADHFSLSSGVFNQLGANATPQGGSSGVPGATVALPLSSQLSNSTSAQIGYQFTASDAVGVSGGFYLNNYRDVPAGIQLFDTRSSQGAGFYTHRITERNWIGASYRFQRLTFTNGTGETLVHSILAFDTFMLPAKMSVSVFAGPEYVDVVSGLLGSSTGTQSKKWSSAAGASFNWTGLRTSFFADFARRTNDGGGLQGATQATSVSGGVRHRLGRAWTTSATATYGVNDSLTTGPGIPESVKWTSFSGSVERAIRESVIFLAGYSHEIQKGQDLVLPDANAHRNRVWFSISYNFTRPLGR